MTATPRPYREGDAAGILDLYREVFRLDQSPAWWKWFNEQMPRGPMVIAILESEGRVVGHYAVQPRPFQVLGRDCVAGLVVGTMVLPAWRNMKAFVDLAHAAYNDCRGRGIPFVYAFPNDQAWRLRRSVLGWSALPEIVEWEGNLPVVAASSHAGSQVGTWDQLPEEIIAADDVWRLAESSETISGTRTAAWLDWRFFRQPGGEYRLSVVRRGGRLAAYAVSKRYRRDGVLFGHVVDWQQSADEVAADELLTEVWRHLAAWGAERISCWALGPSPLAARLKAAGLQPAGRKSNFGYLPLDPRWERQLAHADAWNVQMADSDVY